MSPNAYSPPIVSGPHTAEDLNSYLLSSLSADFVAYCYSRFSNQETVTLVQGPVEGAWTSRNQRGVLAETAGSHTSSQRERLPRRLGRWSVSRFPLRLALTRFRGLASSPVGASEGEGYSAGASSAGIFPMCGSPSSTLLFCLEIGYARAPSFCGGSRHKAREGYSCYVPVFTRSG